MAERRRTEVLRREAVEVPFHGRVHWDLVAPRVERFAGSEEVGGSNPSGSTICRCSSAR